MVIFVIMNLIDKKQLARQHYYLLSNFIVGFVSRFKVHSKNISSWIFLYVYKCIPLVYRMVKQTTHFKRKLYTNLLNTDNLFLRYVLASVDLVFPGSIHRRICGFLDLFSLNNTPLQPP